MTWNRLRSARSPWRAALIPALIFACSTPSSDAGTVLQTSGTSQIDTSRAFASMAFGETIKVPTNGDSRLVSFGIAALVPPNSLTSTVMGELYAWDGFKATGPNLYQSPYTSIPPHSLSNVPPAPIFQTGGIDLTPGGEYVIFLSPFSTTSVYVSIVTGGVGYADGSAVSIRSTNPATWTASNWTLSLDGHTQTNFIATFTNPPVQAAVPEPTTLLSAALGLAGLAGLAGWKRWASAALRRAH